MIVRHEDLSEEARAQSGIINKPQPPIHAHSSDATCQEDLLHISPVDVEL